MAEHANPDDHYLYWAKALDQGPGQMAYHLIPYHSLDVAAVGLSLLERDRLLLSRLEATSGIPAEALKRLLPFLLAIHDIEKFSVRFQNLRSDILAALQPDRRCVQGYTVRHDDMGYWLWERIVLPEFHSTKMIPLDSDDVMDWRDLLDPLARAVIGHHGYPPRFDSSTMDCFENNDKKAVISFVGSTRRLLLKEDLPIIRVEPFEIRESNHRRLSWMVAGLCTLADWIDSDSRYFTYHSERIVLEDYWKEIALPRAGEAIDASGILPPRPRTVTAVEELLPHLSGKSLTPLQEHVHTCRLPGGPQLHIYEDATGSGKIEAAILCAHRLMQAGLSEGLFVALPTMATANAMYLRMSEVYRNLFVKSSRPSLTLAHGGRHLSRPFLDSIQLEDIPRSNEPYVESAEATCSAWLADNRKKSMLAATGVGTIDQALLGVLTSRHQSLRLFGLGRSVLIVDEVHSYDPYMHGLLCSLLSFQAAQGGSAVLLSATLPAKTRTELAEAFAKGLGRKAPKLNNGAYPLVTTVSMDTEREIPVEFRGKSYHVPVTLIHNRSEVVQEIIKTASTGGCLTSTIFPSRIDS